MDDDRHHLHWATALDRLELEVILAERRLLDPDRPAPDTWHVPELSGPIPDDLRERALDLHDRQLRVRVEMTALLGALARQNDFANRVERATRAPSRSVYLDLNA